MQSNATTKAKDLVRYAQPSASAHQRGVAQRGRWRDAQQRGQREQQESLQQRVRPHLAQRQFALAGDHQQRQAEVAEGVTMSRNNGCEARILRSLERSTGTR
jgi:hypothetical protein